MARDHRRLRVYHEAHSLAIAIYRETRDFPGTSAFGIRSPSPARGRIDGKQPR